MCCPLFGVTVSVDPICTEGGTVVWSEQSVSNGVSVLRLEACPDEGYVFNGWMVDGEVVDWKDDFRRLVCPSVTVASNAVVRASFLDAADDFFEFDFSNDLSYFPVGEEVSVELSVDSASFPDLTFNGLPPGLAFSPRTLRIEGTPTTPGLYTIIVSGKNGSGRTFGQIISAEVSNIQGQVLTGTNVTLPIGEYWFSEFTDLFAITSNDYRTIVSVTGYPSGLTWKRDWELLYGTPSRSGVWTIKGTVILSSGKTDTATFLLRVTPPDPGDYGVDIGAVEDLEVGDCLESRMGMLGSFAAKTGIVSVSGLPHGLFVETWTEGGVKYFGAVGTVTEAGVYTVRIKVQYQDGDKYKTVTTEREVIVSERPSSYLKVASRNPSLGTVSGGGAFVSTVARTVTARAAKGAVFAGWYDEYGEPFDFGPGVDYRKPTVTFPVGTDFTFMSLYAEFVAVDDDRQIAVDGLSESRYGFHPESYWEESFTVDSLSLPVLRFKGLPVGVAVSAGMGGDYRFVFDPENASRTPMPGRYDVTMTAVNQSKATVTENFRVVVENLHDDRILVDDDYGAYKPGYEISPIDLSQAVDFQRGETLVVSGLPKGLTFNKTANEKKGIAANTVTGTPTAPGEYTLAFTARVVAEMTTNGAGRVSTIYTTAKATAYLTILPYPELAVGLDNESMVAGNSVTGAGNYKPGAKVTLKAKSAPGWVFAGWRGLEGVDELVAKDPSYAMVTGTNDTCLVADFVPIAQDTLFVTRPEPSSDGFDLVWRAGEELSGTLSEGSVRRLIETISYPTITVSGLPKGVKFSGSTFLLSGKPQSPGVYVVTVTARNLGGYSFIRFLNVAVRDANGALPSVKPLDATADVDFTPLSGLMAGTHYDGAVTRLEVGPQRDSLSWVKKVTVTGVPKGLTATVQYAEGGAVVVFSGTTAGASRQTMTLSVTYMNGATAKSSCVCMVEDQRSRYLAVICGQPTCGKVSGGNAVYAAGATVKLTASPAAQQVFTRWLQRVDDMEMRPFTALTACDGVDVRTAAVSFPMRPDDFGGDFALYADFAPKTSDGIVGIQMESNSWIVDPNEASAFLFAVESLSLPKVTVMGLPKGVTVDAARGKLVYTPVNSVKSGIYPVKISAQNASGGRSSTALLEVCILNRTSPVIEGLDSDMDAYRLWTGVMVDPQNIVPRVPDGWTLSVKDLPTGMTWKNGVLSGVPTKAGVSTLTFTATMGSGALKRTEVATIMVQVETLPIAATGTFNGIVHDEQTGVVYGTITATATASGRLSVKIVTAGESASFTANAWDCRDENGRVSVAVQAKSGQSVEMSLDAAAVWTDWGLTGVCQMSDGRTYGIRAQRNSYGAKDGVIAAREAVSALVGTYPLGSLTLSIAGTGVAKVVGRYEGQSISGSTVVLFDSGFCVKFVKKIGKIGIFELNVRFDDGGAVREWTAEIHE